MAWFTFKGEDRQAGAIGAFEPFEEAVDARNPIEGKEALIRRRNEAGRQDVRVTEITGAEVHTWTFERAYVLGSYSTVVIEAPTYELACAKALEVGDDDWADFEDDGESSSSVYLSDAVEGEHDNTYSAGLVHLPIPYPQAKDAEVLDWLGLKPLIDQALTAGPDFDFPSWQAKLKEALNA
jgi:hypothetical protein